MRPLLLVFLIGCGTSGGASSSASSNASAAPPGAEAGSSPGTSGEVPAPAEAGAAAKSCPPARAPEVTGRVAAAAVDEASGIVSSALNPDVYWVHNDSGDSARAFAVDAAGKHLATLVFDSANAVDIEDIAIEDVGPGESYLYFADIGDNASARAELTLHRVAEPKLTGPAPQALKVTGEKMKVKYADGAHDAETLLFDPTTKDLLIATKRLFGGSAIHRVGRFAAGTTATTEAIATVPVDFATGGDIARDGRAIAIRNYGSKAFLWTRAVGEPLETALARRPCEVPVAEEKQGEALGFLASGAGYVTLSEGSLPELHVARFE